MSEKASQERALYKEVLKAQIECNRALSRAIWDNLVWPREIIRVPGSGERKCKGDFVQGVYATLGILSFKLNGEYSIDQIRSLQLEVSDLPLYDEMVEESSSGSVGDYCNNAFWLYMAKRLETIRDAGLSYIDWPQHHALGVAVDLFRKEF